MKKLIISSLILASMSGSVFALTCPSIKEVVHGTRWIIPNGWLIHEEINTSSVKFPMHVLAVAKDGELTCTYLTLQSELQIKRISAPNTDFKFNENWRTAGEAYYFCQFADNENDCSFNIVN